MSVGESSVLMAYQFDSAIYIYTSGGTWGGGGGGGIHRTIKYECVIIAHHERKVGEMLISSVFMTKRCTIFTLIDQ